VTTQVHNANIKHQNNTTKS